jgi:hypothetical protein
VRKNTEIVANARAQQYGHEVDTWLRTLDYLQQENIYLKNRVADLLKYEMNSSVLEKVEYFHNKFIDKDAVLSLLRHDITQLAANIGKTNGNGVSAQVLLKEEHLRRDMARMEAEFGKLKSDFNQYVFDVILPATA